MPVLIRDGYTLKGKIEAFGRTPEVNFTYRPALPEQVYEYLITPTPNGKQKIKQVTEFLKEHLVSWDVIDEDKNPVPINTENLRATQQKVLAEMVNYITGYAETEAEEDAKNSVKG